VLDAIRWDDETTCTLHGHRFQFVKHEDAGGIPAPPVDAFNVVKWPNMLDHFQQLVGDLQPVETVVELGIYHGGSTVLLNELLRPRRLIAIDLTPASPAPRFDRYVAEHPEVSAHWGVDQSDRAAVLAAVGTEPIDLVVDDASHFYDLTAASFDVLFPRLRPGGRYLIEDWNWSFLPHHAEIGRWRVQRSMSDLLLDLAGLSLARPGTIGRITVLPSFIAVERGDADATGIDVRGDPYRRSDHRRNSRFAAVKEPASRIVRKVKHRLC
jgi:hypothetical protein